MSMRSVLWLTLAACLEGTSVGAASLDMSTVTCERFLETTDSRTLPIVVGWLIGHHATSDARAAIDFDKADRSSAELLKVCGDNPLITVSAASERLHY
jgi:HdeA/HdeB family